MAASSPDGAARRSFLRTHSQTGQHNKSPPDSHKYFNHALRCHRRKALSFCDITIDDFGVSEEWYGESISPTESSPSSKSTAPSWVLVPSRPASAPPDSGQRGADAGEVDEATQVQLHSSPRRARLSISSMSGSPTFSFKDSSPVAQEKARPIIFSKSFSLNTTAIRGNPASMPTPRFGFKPIECQPSTATNVTVTQKSGSSDLDLDPVQSRGNGSVSKASKGQVSAPPRVTLTDDLRACQDASISSSSSSGAAQIEKSGKDLSTAACPEGTARECHGQDSCSSQQVRCEFEVHLQQHVACSLPLSSLQWKVSRAWQWQPVDPFNNSFSCTSGCGAVR
jgi:hypothetical protein